MHTSGIEWAILSQSGATRPRGSPLARGSGVPAAATLGVELELHLVDADTRDLAGRAGEVLAELDPAEALPEPAAGTGAAPRKAQRELWASSRFRLVG